MKTKIRNKLTLTILLLSGSLLAFAGTQENEKMSGHDKMHGSEEMSQDMAGMKGMHMDSEMDRMQGKMPMMQARMSMMQGMMKPEVVPTQDGGIVIVMGGFILKYDSELNLVRKTEIEIGSDDMKAMMKKHKRMCRMMMGNKMNQSDESE
jgi:hypothetical protein